jgi:hypothetical protein
MYQMTDADVAREFLQYRVIRSVFSRSVNRQTEIALKGGFAMRAMFGSHRATKDIDLQQDGSKIPLSRLQGMMRSAIREALSDTGMTNVRISEPKQTETVARWKIGGITPAGSEIHLTIEVSRRGMPEQVKVVHGMNGKIKDVDVVTYDESAMAASKVIALVAAPHRVAIRDVWDLDILIRMEARPPLDMISFLNQEESVSMLYAKLEMMTWEGFQTEVAPYLDAKTRMEFKIDDFETMKIRVATSVEKWLSELSEINHNKKIETADFAPA